MLKGDTSVFSQVETRRYSFCTDSSARIAASAQEVVRGRGQKKQPRLTATLFLNTSNPAYPQALMLPGPPIDYSCRGSAATKRSTCSRRQRVALTLVGKVEPGLLKPAR